MTKYVSIVLFALVTISVMAQTNEISSFNWSGSIVSSEKSETLPNAHVQIFSNSRIFLFCSDNNGHLDISFIYPTLEDSMIISFIGYKSTIFKCKDLMQKKELVIEPSDFFIDEVVVHPKKIKTKKLGNRDSFAIGSTGGWFEQQGVLFIPPGEDSGARILTLRYYMGGLISNNKKDYGRIRYNPFRIRLYEKDMITNSIGKDILKEPLIVSLKDNAGWIEVDISNYNIYLPSNGIFVGFEILPEEYYFQNNIISKRSVGKYNVVNSIVIGITKSNKNEKIESWETSVSTLRWIPTKPKNWHYLINIIIEKQS